MPIWKSKVHLICDSNTLTAVSLKLKKIMIFISYQEEPTEQMKENMKALKSIFKMLKSFPAVPEDHFLQNGV